MIVASDIEDAAGKAGNLQEIFGLLTDTPVSDPEYIRQLNYAVDLANAEVTTRLGRAFLTAQLDPVDARNVIITGARIAVLLAKQQNTTVTAEEQEELTELRARLDAMRNGPLSPGESAPINQATDRGGSVGDVAVINAPIGFLSPWR